MRQPENVYWRRRIGALITLVLVIGVVVALASSGGSEDKQPADEVQTVEPLIPPNDTGSSKRKRTRTQTTTTGEEGTGDSMGGGVEAPPSGESGSGSEGGGQENGDTGGGTQDGSSGNTQGGGDNNGAGDSGDTGGVSPP